MNNKFYESILNSDSEESILEIVDDILYKKTLDIKDEDLFKWAQDNNHYIIRALTEGYEYDFRDLDIITLLREGLKLYYEDIFIDDELKFFYGLIDNYARLNNIPLDYDEARDIAKEYYVETDIFDLTIEEFEFILTENEINSVDIIRTILMNPQLIKDKKEETMDYVRESGGLTIILSEDKLYEVQGLYSKPPESKIVLNVNFLGLDVHWGEVYTNIERKLGVLLATELTNTRAEKSLNLLEEGLQELFYDNLATIYLVQDDLSTKVYNTENLLELTNENTVTKAIKSLEDDNFFVKEIRY